MDSCLSFQIYVTPVPEICSTRPQASDAELWERAFKFTVQAETPHLSCLWLQLSVAT